MTPSPRLFDSVGECVEGALQRVGREIVLAVPLGIGKTVPPGNQVFPRAVAGETALSLSSNPDIRLDLLPRLAAIRRTGREIVTIGEVNSQLPFMLGDAEVPADSFDYLIEHPSDDYDLFCPPNMAIGSV